MMMTFTLVEKRLLCLCKDIFILQLWPASLHESKYYIAREIVMPTSIERQRFSKHLDQFNFVAKLGLSSVAIIIYGMVFAIEVCT